MGGGMGCGTASSKQKVLVYPSIRSSGLTPVGAAVGTLSQQKPWGWGWQEPTFNTGPLSVKYGVTDA